MKALDALTRRFPPQPLGKRLGPAFGGGLDVIGACEHRDHAKPYRWDGLRRGQPATRPIALLQYTLGGLGAIESNRRTFTVPPEHCMIAIIPSKHVYYLPSDQQSWRFLWVMIGHAYVVRRLLELVSRTGPVLAAPAGSELPQQISGLLQAHQDDALTRENRLLDLIIAAERTAQATRPAGSEQERLLARVRQFVNAHGMARPNIEAIAAEFGMSRSNFSHHFRGETGRTPAAFVRELRLDRARDEVVGTGTSMKSIARSLGFADANHFGKAFAARFGFTPAALRRQVHGRWPTIQ